MKRRRHSTLRSVRWTFLVPVDLAAIIENAFWDPLRQKPLYGARNAFMIQVLREAIIQRGLDREPPKT